MKNKINLLSIILLGIFTFGCSLPPETKPIEENIPPKPEKKQEQIIETKPIKKETQNIASKPTPLPTPIETKKEEKKVEVKKVVEEKKMEIAKPVEMMPIIGSGQISGSGQVQTSLPVENPDDMMKRMQEESKAYSEAITKGEITPCKKLSSKESQKNCEKNFWQQQVVIKNDPELCKNIPEFKDQKSCLDNFYSSTNECNKIQDENLKKNCNDRAILNKAIQEKDESVCEGMREPLMQEMCLGQIAQSMVQKAISEDSENACKELKNQKIQNNCLSSYWRQQVMVKDDVSLCQNLPEENERNVCSDNFYMTKKECGRVKDVNMQNNCNNSAILEKAMQKKDKTICEQIEEPMMKEMCKMNIQTMSNQPQP